MTKLILTTCVVLSVAIGSQAAPIQNLKVTIDNRLVAFTSAPIFKVNAWLVPIESICEQLDLKVEYPDGGSMAVICGGQESELCVPLHFSENAFSIHGVTYAQLESITEPFGFEIYKVSDTELEVVRPELLAHTFTLSDLDDTPRRLQDFRGKKTLLYIWGSW